MNSRADVAAEVRAALGRANMTSTSLATKISLSRAGLSERLNGHRAFSTDQLTEIGDALGVDPLAFLMASSSAVKVPA